MNNSNGRMIRILLGSGDRNLSSLIEASLRDACFGQADIEITRMARLNDFIRQAGYEGFDLMIVAPDSFLAEPNRKSPVQPEEEVIRAIRSLKIRHSTPVFAVGLSEDQETPFLEAGAEEVFRGVLDRESFKSAIRHGLYLSEQPDPAPGRLSFFSFLLRGLQGKSA